MSDAFVCGTRLVVGGFEAAALRERREELLRLIEDRKAKIAAKLAPPAPPAVSKQEGPAKLRLKLEIAPLLNSSGAAVFDATNGNFPVIRLPPLETEDKKKRLRFVNRLPRPERQIEEQRRLEEAMELERLQSALGVDATELRSMELELAGMPAEEQRRRLLLLEETPAPCDSLTGLVLERLSTADHQKTAELEELAMSLDAAADIESSLENAKAQTQRMRFRPRSQATRAIARKWAAGKLYRVLRDLQLSFLFASLSRWRRIAEEARRAETFVRYRRYQGTRRLALAAERCHLRALAIGYLKWKTLVDDYTALKRHNTAIQIVNATQRHFRSRRAMRLAAARRAVLRKQQEERSAAVLQNWYRQRRAVRTVEMSLAAARQRKATLLLQRQFRAYLAKCRRWVLAQIRRRDRAVLTLQSLRRGCVSRRRSAAIALKKREFESTLLLQRALRGRRGRRAAAARRHARRRLEAAMLIQRILRNRLEGNAMLRRIERLAKYAVESAAQAKRMQALYRGKRARQNLRLQDRSVKKRHKRDRKAAVAIQAWARGCLLRAAQARTRDAAFAAKVEKATEWKQLFSEEEGCQVYVNEHTGEVVNNTAPECGYVDAAGDVFLDGERLANNPLTQEERLAKERELLCSECEEADATRLCDQCGDQFCARCWSSVHANGRRRLHHFTHLGSKPECSECEVQLADRWCLSCDDFFCEDDFKRLHGVKGKKAAHKSRPCGAATLYRMQHHTQSASG